MNAPVNNLQPHQMIGQVTVDQTKLQKPKEYYACLDGCRYIFKNGHEARFENGIYVTDKKGEIEELDELMKLPGQYLFSDKPMEVQRSDAKILKDVSSAKSGSIAHSGTGTLSSAQLAGLSAGR